MSTRLDDILDWLCDYWLIILLGQMVFWNVLLVVAIIMASKGAC